jgi:hypothetical protein
MAGGFYAGRIRIADQLYAIIAAPKAEGEHKPAIWIPGNKAVHGARSYNDGLANTTAMADAGSKLAQWALGLRIAGFGDWYIPSQDELEVMYRNLKPTAEKNWCYARSGINLHAAEPTLPYTPDLPVQTVAEAFKAGADEAFDADWYWSSTQHVSPSDFAWYQGFGDGYQYYSYTDNEFRARAVRRLVIE